MRTLKLTEEEISLIQRALGIAEMKFNETRKKYLEELVNIRGIGNVLEIGKEADFMLKRENEFCDLLLSIKSGEKDV